jgi:hypothetical protein
MNVHMNATHNAGSTTQVDGEITLEFLRKFIQYARRFLFVHLKLFIFFFETF